MHNLIIIAALAFTTGIWTAGMRDWSLSFLYLLAFIVLSMGIWGMWSINFKPQRIIGVIAALFFILGMICAVHDAALPPMDVSRYTDSVLKIEGTIDEIPELIRVDDSRILAKYIVKIKKLPDASPDLQAVGKIRLNVLFKEDHEPVAFAKFGDYITARGKLLKLHGYNNPGQIDVVTSMKRQGITAKMTVQSSNFGIVSRNETEYSLKQELADWREKITAVMHNVIPENDSGILSGMIFGGYKGIRRDVLDDFATTGMVHILSVSGAHIAIVAAALGWLGRTLRLPNILTIFIITCGIIFYSLISGLTPPVIRSAIMGIVALGAVLVRRERYSPAILALTGLLMLAYQPLLIYDISFQLSFSATAGLVFLYQRTLDQLAWMPEYLACPLSVTIAAQLGSLPFMAWYFNNFSLVSFVANIALLPIIEFSLILGLIAALCCFIVPAAAGILFVVCSLLIGIVIYFAKLLSGIPGGVQYLPSIGLIDGLLYYVVIAWLYGYITGTVPGKAGLRECSRLSSDTAKKLCITALIILIILSPQIYRGYSGPVTIHFIDVGQGDATLIITPKGRGILVDTGGTMGENNGFDIGEKVVYPYLKHYGLNSLEFLILTHGHQDHAGGAAGIAANMPIKNIIVSREVYTPATRMLLRQGAGSVVIPAYTGQSFYLDGVAIIVEQAEERTDNGQNQSNETSNIIRVVYGEHSVLITGDMGQQGERSYIAAKREPSTILKIGHHGAKTSSSEEFLKVVSPQYAIISVGYANRFGHPHRETLKRLSDRNLKVYRTDLNGAVVFETDGKNIQVETFK
ncbi:MAG TPA: DNA internalization-related competence protein ComEC/Rec2 [Methylomusa anaerophila]|uniref:ComEC family competence protein n=1 Tax=Methylomusa anaerophila TaxID=1930071 RepID=A0A348ANW7_9FIRM|nr:DNA internalization-related competence protein ComEC/Rec2 [Methylomusa anaerophila]BBB92765.1 ComEC family competence protein [Methylomusa anaerophila]HML87384.1 DNA internalization-related competence protein ComEC/Rec2 [Methylomusa anaerophila]